jgi:hypothetical protein
MKFSVLHATCEGVFVERDGTARPQIIPRSGAHKKIGKHILRIIRGLYS